MKLTRILYEASAKLVKVVLNLLFTVPAIEMFPSKHFGQLLKLGKGNFWTLGRNFSPKGAWNTTSNNLPVLKVLPDNNQPCLLPSSAVPYLTIPLLFLPSFSLSSLSFPWNPVYGYEIAVNPPSWVQAEPCHQSRWCPDMKTRELRSMFVNDLDRSGLKI